jgi:methionyl-tRNA formyltransferase
MPAQTPKGIGGKLGEIVEAGAAGFTVVCADGRFNVLRVKGPDGGKVSAGDFVKSAGLIAGTRLV